MITQVTYQRVWTLGPYESLRLEAVATVEDGDVEAAWLEARMSVIEARLSLEPIAAPPPPAENGNGRPKTALEAEHRFFARYGETIGGTTWKDVERYTGKSEPKPVTVDGWLELAKAVRDMAATPNRAALVRDLAIAIAEARKQGHTIMSTGTKGLTDEQIVAKLGETRRLIDAKVGGILPIGDPNLVDG